MSNITRDFFMALSKNDLLNKGAQKWGLRLGAEQFVAGVDVDSVVKSAKKLNDDGISCTIDHLGEFVTDKNVTLLAKQRIIELIKKIYDEQLDCHISIKLTQLGLDIDNEFCYENTKEIVDVAYNYNTFINIDTEDYAHLPQTLHILHKLRENYSNVGTVIQSYLYIAEEEMDQLKNTRLRIVKGAYKENEQITYQTKEDIDRNFLKLAKKRLKGSSFTSIATHDHHIINELKRFVEQEKIDKGNFEFQMLYGFRIDMQHSLVKEGYNFCTYIPFGDDWYGYFMRRLAERPQNINLIIKDKLYNEDNRLKKTPVIIAVMTAVLGILLICRRKK